MRDSARARLLVGIALTAAVAVLGLSGCGRLGGESSPSGDGSVNTTDLAWDAQALEAIGFSADEMAPVAAVAAVGDPTPSASKPARDGDKRHPRFKRLRYAFGHRVMHGEAVVQTEEGTKTVVVQRGSVTAIDAGTVTVKSADGFTLTWKFGDPLHVIEHRTTVQPSAIAVGAEVGIAGAKEGGDPVARLIVIPGAKVK